MHTYVPNSKHRRVSGHAHSRKLATPQCSVGGGSTYDKRTPPMEWSTVHRRMTTDEELAIM